VAWTTFGPYPVLKQEVRTGVQVRAGDVARTVASGTIDFGGAVLGLGAPKLDAAGDSSPTPLTYPAPYRRKNSLLCRVGGVLYQGGVDSSFRVLSSGEVVLGVNDGLPEDNLGGWQVRIYVERSSTLCWRVLDVVPAPMLIALSLLGASNVG
jgi:hypothetical protein